MISVDALIFVILEANVMEKHSVLITNFSQKLFLSSFFNGKFKQQMLIELEDKNYRTDFQHMKQKVGRTKKPFKIPSVKLAVTATTFKKCRLSSPFSCEVMRHKEGLTLSKGGWQTMSETVSLQLRTS